MIRISIAMLVLTLVTWTTTANAGTVTVRDGSNTLSRSDLSDLSTKARDWPFDLHIIFAVVPDRAALEDQAHGWVDSPKVVVGVDPQHHFVVARFGTGTGVKQPGFDSVAKAGNANFRSGEWRQGIEAVALRAKASAQTTTSIATSNDPVIVKEGLGAGTWFLIFLGGAALIGFIVWMARKQKRDREDYERTLEETREEAQELRSRNIKDSAWEDKVRETAYRTPSRPAGAADRGASPGPTAARGGYVSPVTPVVQQQVVVQSGSGSNDLLTGVLLGEAMADCRAPAPVVIEREYERPSPRSYDSGGSDSSFGSGSSTSYDSPSNDSGGSSSSFDSGGSSSFDSGGSSSFDSGGSSGGFDSGGGGGDF